MDENIIKLNPSGNFCRYIEDLDPYKKRILDSLSDNSSLIILEIYPLHAQINSSLGIYGESYTSKMILFINTVRTISNKYKEIINNIETIENLIGIEEKISYNNLRKEVESLLGDLNKWSKT